MSIDFKSKLPELKRSIDIINSELIGEVYDMVVKLYTFTPWHHWKFLVKIPRVESLYYSNHYIDMVRFFLGDLYRGMTKKVKHPTTTVTSTKNTILLDYGNDISASIAANHDHDFDLKHQQSFIKWNGTKGAIYAK